MFQGFARLLIGANCYAEQLHRTRLDGKGGYPHFRPWVPENADHNVTLRPERLDQPLRWARPRMIFANSMSDLFHELVPDAYIAEVFAVMLLAPRHTFQVLTKRPERAQELLSDAFPSRVVEAAHRLRGRPADRARAETRLHFPWPLPNVWLGTSIENRQFVSRADHLRATPAAVRFISAEPLLGPLVPSFVSGFGPSGTTWSGYQWPDGKPGHAPAGLDLRGIDWLIVGGESGPGHRRIEEKWVRDLKEACLMRSGPRPAFFLKQWGGHTPKAGGRELDGRTWDEMPVRPVSEVPSA